MIIVINTLYKSWEPQLPTTIHPSNCKQWLHQGGRGCIRNCGVQSTRSADRAVAAECGFKTSGCLKTLLMCRFQTISQAFYAFYRAALNAGQSSHEKAVCPSVRPSVCLSNACIVTKRKKLVPHSYTTWNIIYPNFLTRRMVGGASLLPEILGQVTPLERSRRFSVDIRS